MNCPHCQSLNPEGAEFCGDCGKALPQIATGPRVVSGTDDLASTAAGQELQSEELLAKSKTARRTLMAVALLMALATGLIYALAEKTKKEIALMPVEMVDQEKAAQILSQNRLLVGVNMLITLAYFGLYFWARVNPLPAAITGLAIFVTLQLVGVVVDPTSLAKGIIVKVLIIGALVKAIQAGLAHRKLKQQMGQPHFG